MSLGTGEDRAGVVCRGLWRKQSLRVDAILNGVLNIMRWEKLD